MFIQSDVWHGGRETGEAIPFIGPSLGRSLTAKKPEKQIDPNKLRGVVTSFNLARKYGFINTQAGDYLFVSIRNCGELTSLTQGQKVAFDIGEDRSGKPCAVNVELLF